MTTDIVTSLRELGVIALIVIDDPDRAGDLARALEQGGLPCAEIAFRTEAAVEALRRIADEHPRVLVGAGTILTPEQAAQVGRIADGVIIGSRLVREVEQAPDPASATRAVTDFLREARAAMGRTSADE